MASASSVVFYIGAHQDDWQLFMAPQAYHDLLAEDTRVVFIYTTAGDAGGDVRWQRGRSAGALSSIQFATRQRIAAVAPEPSEGNGRPIPRYTVANTHSYFLSLPDGNGDGSGFPATGHASLQKLHAGRIPGIDALVDQPEYATRYTSWQDLVATITALLEREAPVERYAASTVHLLDPQVTQHADHTWTGIAVADALAGSTRFHQAMYHEYATPEMAPNVEGVELVRKAGLYLFYAQTACEWSGRLDHLDDWRLSFVPRQYRTR